MYDSIDDLPFVCRLNLPEAALDVYRRAFNRAWRAAKDDSRRYASAQRHAWAEVRRQFEKERETGRWVPRTARLEPRLAAPRKQATRKSARR